MVTTRLDFAIGKRHGGLRLKGPFVMSNQVGRQCKGQDIHCLIRTTDGQHMCDSA
jgi:hypothetical protein